MWKTVGMCLCDNHDVAFGLLQLIFYRPALTDNPATVVIVCTLSERCNVYFLQRFSQGGVCDLFTLHRRSLITGKKQTPSRQREGCELTL